MIDNTPAAAGAAFNDAWERYNSAIERFHAEDMPRLIRGTADYIHQAQQLALI